MKVAAGYALTGVLMLAGVGILAWVRVANIDETETRLIVDHWPMILLGVACACGAALAHHLTSLASRRE